jgi:hypothetical protein
MLPNGHSGSAPDRQVAHLMMFGLNVAVLCSCMPNMEAMQEDCVILAHLQMHAVIFNAALPCILGYHPLQIGIAEARHNVPYRPVHLLQHDVTTASAYRHH